MSCALGGRLDYRHFHWRVDDQAERAFICMEHHDDGVYLSLALSDVLQSVMG